MIHYRRPVTCLNLVSTPWTVEDATLDQITAKTSTLYHTFLSVTTTRCWIASQEMSGFLETVLMAYVIVEVPGVVIKWDAPKSQLTGLVQPIIGL